MELTHQLIPLPRCSPSVLEQLARCDADDGDIGVDVRDGISIGRVVFGITARGSLSAFGPRGYSYSYVKGHYSTSFFLRPEPLGRAARAGAAGSR